MSRPYAPLNCFCPFRRLTDAQTQRFQHRIHSHIYPAHSVVYSPAHKLDSVFVLESGFIKLFHRTWQGKDGTLMLVGPGQIFGELSLFELEPRSEFAETVERSTVLEIPSDLMWELMEYPEVKADVADVVRERRQYAERRLKNLLFTSIRERLVHLLLDLAEQFGEPTDGGIRIRINLSHQELANMIGSTRETVTVVLGELKERKILSVGHRQIVLNHLEELARTVRRRLPVITSKIPTFVTGHLADTFEATRN